MPKPAITLHRPGTESHGGGPPRAAAPGPGGRRAAAPQALGGAGPAAPDRL